MKMKKTFRKIITPEGRLSYPAILAPKFNKLSGRDEYSCVLLFRKGQDLSVLKNLIRETGAEKWGPDQARWPRSEGLGPRIPLRDQGEKADEEGRLPRGLETGAFFATLRSVQPPGVVGPDNSWITEERDLYPGCWVKCSVTCYTYGGPGTTFRAGIGLGLQNVQKQRDGEPLGAPRMDPEEEFKPVDGVDLAGVTGSNPEDELI